MAKTFLTYYSFRVIFKPNETMKIYKIKDAVWREKQLSLVYKLTCDTWKTSYIEKKKKPLEISNSGIFYFLDLNRCPYGQTTVFCPWEQDLQVMEAHYTY